jgi:hypothetical protein
VVVNMRNGDYKYSIRVGTREVAKSNNFISSITYFK